MQLLIGGTSQTVSLSSIAPDTLTIATEDAIPLAIALLLGHLGKNAADVEQAIRVGIATDGLASPTEETENNNQS